MEGEPSLQEATAALAALAGAFLDAGRRPSPAAVPAFGEEAPALVVIDGGGSIRAFDAQAERLWRCPAAEVVGTPIADLIDPVPDAATSTGLVRRGGEAVLVSRHALEIAGEALIALVVRRQPAGSGTELRYRNLVEQIPAVVFTAALEGGLSDIYVGPQIEALLGYTQEQWLQNPVLWYERLHPDDRLTLDREFARGCATGGPFRAECRFLAADGRVVWVHGEARLISGSGGLPLFLQGVAFDITESKRAEELVRASLREKELLLKEIHHRVKNNLQITSSLLRLQAAKLPDEAVRQTLRESQDRVRSIALVHEMLYRSPDLARVNFGDYVNALIRQLLRSHRLDTRHITHSVDLDDAALGVDVAVPFGLILNELVVNALKHAFPGGRNGAIQVNMRQEGGWARVTVRDDGVGLPPGFDLERTGSLGFRLVRTLVDQLGGRLGLESAAGTTVTITFPIPAAP